MGARESVTSALRRALYVSPLVLTVNENVASMCGVEGRSMQPTFNPEGQLLSDRVILDKLSARYCTFQRGDVIVLRSVLASSLLHSVCALPETEGMRQKGIGQRGLYEGNESQGWDKEKY